MKEKNQAILRKTLNLRQSLVTIMSKNRANYQGYEGELSCVVDKIRFRKAHALQKIKQLKYLRANKQKEGKAMPDLAALPGPMIELKNASEMLGKRSLYFYEELKELIRVISR